jgi:hypothetical protein
LHKGVAESTGYLKIGLVKALKKKASFITKNFGLEQQNPFKGCGRDGVGHGAVGWVRLEREGAAKLVC